MKLNKIILLTCLCAFSAQAAAHEGNWCQRKWGAFKSLFHRHHRGPVQTIVTPEVEEEETPADFVSDTSLPFVQRFAAAKIIAQKDNNPYGYEQLMQSGNLREVSDVIFSILDELQTLKPWVAKMPSRVALTAMAVERLLQILPYFIQDATLPHYYRYHGAELAFEHGGDYSGFMMIMETGTSADLSYQNTVAYILKNLVKFQPHIVVRAQECLEQICSSDELSDIIRRRFNLIRSQIKPVVIQIESDGSSDDDYMAVMPTTWGPKQTYLDISRSDSVLFHSTLFPRKDRSDRDVSIQEREEQTFLKRYLVFLALAPLRYSNVENGVPENEWDKPLSLALGHGGRVLFEVARHENLASSSDAVMRALFGGSPNAGKMNGVEMRSMASHGLRVSKSGHLEEIQDFSLKQKGTHYGYDFSFGGIGNVDINGDEIGPRGTRIRNGKKRKKVQHGHAYIYAETFENVNGLLIGFESSAPGKTNMMGAEHNILSPFKAQSNPSITGGLKKADLFLPAELGSYRVLFSAQKFMQILNVANYLMTLPTEQQEYFFMYMLNNPPEISRQLLMEYKDISDAYRFIDPRMYSQQPRN
jgi:hypothetical protein